MVKTSKANIEKRDEQTSKFFDGLKAGYLDRDMNKFYGEECDNFELFVYKKALKNCNKGGKLDITGTKKGLSVAELEKYLPKTTAYIKSRIWHGYDSKYYVCTYSDNGCFFPREYSPSDFSSTFSKYFPDNVSNWFNKYSDKFTLSLDNTKPRTYEDSDGMQHLNLFDGYRFDRTAKKDEERIKKGEEGVQTIWNHIKEVLCSNDEEYFKYFQKWIRKMIYGIKMETLIYIRAKMGRGKGKITSFFMNILGRKVCVPLQNDEPFTGNFNGPLMGKALCLLDEIVHDFAGFKNLYNELKTYITEPYKSYRNLYESTKTLRNLTSFLMTGNYAMLKLDDPTSGEDRRIVVLPTSDVVKDFEYCRKLDNACDSDDVQYAFFWDCVDNVDLSFKELEELKKLPMSEPKKDMIQQSLDSGTNYLKSIVNNSELMNTYVRPIDLYESYTTWMKVRDTKKVLNNHSFLEKLKNYNGFITFYANKKINGRNPTNYLKIDREKMVNEFTSRHFWSVYDDYVGGDIDEVEVDDIDEQKQIIEKLKEQLNKAKARLGKLETNKREQEYEERQEKIKPKEELREFDEEGGIDIMNDSEDEINDKYVDESKDEPKEESVKKQTKEPKKVTVKGKPKKETKKETKKEPKQAVLKNVKAKMIKQTVKSDDETSDISSVESDIEDVEMDTSGIE